MLSINAHGGVGCDGGGGRGNEACVQAGQPPWLECEHIQIGALTISPLATCAAPAHLALLRASTQLRYTPSSYVYTVSVCTQTSHPASSFTMSGSSSMFLNTSHICACRLSARTLRIARTSEAKGLTCAVNRLDVLCVGLCHLLLQCLQPFDLGHLRRRCTFRRDANAPVSPRGRAQAATESDTPPASPSRSSQTQAPSCLLKDVSMSHSRHARVRV